MRELVACAFIGPGRENGMNGMVFLARPGEVPAELYWKLCFWPAGEVPAELYWKLSIIRVWPDANRREEKFLVREEDVN